jgi:capsule polysaccharide export protein KpsE/RkpR
VVSEHKSLLEKNHEKVVSSKDSTLEGMANEYKKEIDFQKKMVRDYEDKAKQQAIKIIEQEGQLEITKNGLDKAKRSLDNAHKEINELKEREKGLRKNLKVREE